MALVAVQVGQRGLVEGLVRIAFEPARAGIARGRGLDYLT